jgi:hypothetical protein
MNDGNKESTKELLAIFRTLMATSVSVLLVATNLALNQLLVPNNLALFAFSMGCLALSAAACMVSFFIVVPMLYHEREDIVYRPPVVVAGLAAIALFACAITSLILSQL